MRARQTTRSTVLLVDAQLVCLLAFEVCIDLEIKEI